MRHLIRLCIDQGLSSLSLFMFSITLAREFGAAEFSTYAVALSTSLMVMAIFNSAYIEPTAFKDSDGISRRTVATKILTLTLTTSIACLFFIDKTQFFSVFSFVAGSSTLYAVRRIKALNGEQNKLTIISTTSFALTILALLVLDYKQAPLSLWLITYGLIGVSYIFFIPETKHKSKTSPPADFKSLFIAIMFWVCSNYFFYYLPAIGRAVEGGQLRIIYTLFMPILQAGTIAGSIYISKKSSRKTVLPATIFITIIYGLMLIAVGPDTIFKITNIPISRVELLFATIMVVANSSAGLQSISMRMQNCVKPLLASSTLSAAALISLGFLADDLNKIMMCITLSFLLSTTLSQAIRHMQK